MRRWLVVISVVLGALAATSAASANRGYGGYEPFSEELVTFELSDTAPHAIRSLTVRLDMACDGYGFGYPATFRIVRRRPPGSARNQDFLVLDRPRHAALRAVWGTARSHTTYTGSLSITRVTERSASVRIVLRSVNSRDRSDRCFGELSVRAQREPGVLYVGATNDEEPVLLRREGDTIEWLSGFGTGCRPDGSFEGVFADAIAMTGPTTFGWPGLIDGFSTGEFNWLWAISAHVQGRLEPGQANGTVRLVGSGGLQRAERCDTGIRRWRAVSR